VIDNTDASQFHRDAALLAWCVAEVDLSRVRSLRPRSRRVQSHRTDALKHESAPSSRNRDSETESLSGGPDRKNAVPTAKDRAEQSLAVGQPLDFKGSERTERKNAG
jgi:hypothetical protein